jgi:hypothetical protein
MLARMLRLSLALAAVLAVPACFSGPQGTIEVFTGVRTESLSAVRLAELPQVEVSFGDQKYSGPRLREALLAVGVAAGVDVEAIAVDGYKQTIDAATVARDDVIVAIGLGVDEGPLRVIVPGSRGLSVRQLSVLRATIAAAP